ncbi:MAG: GEVED domain-containing protein, partial [Verrucomicrobiota bacterium]
AYAFGSEQTFTSLTDSIAAADSLFIWTIPADLPEGLYRIRISDASDTAIFDERAIMINPQPDSIEIIASGPLAFCPSDSVILMVEPDFASYEWSTGDTTTSVTVRITSDIYLTVTDSNGCQGISDLIAVVVSDTISPTVVTQDITVILDTAGVATVTPAQIDSGSSDNCGIASLSLSQTVFISADIGVNQVTLIATDASGNVGTGTAAVIVPDTEAPSVPTSLTAFIITGNTVDLRWNTSTDNVKVTGYDIYQGATIIDSVAVTSYQVTGLTINTSYAFTVRAKDAAGNVSAESNALDVTTDSYCASQSSNVNNEHIGRVQLNTIDNTSSGKSYSDFTNISTTLSKGSQYTFEITPTWPGEIYTEGYAVWIDYNNDGDFEDADEQVFSQVPTTSTPVSGSFTVPADAAETSTRMRVSLKLAGIPTSCEWFDSGEVEDYTVIIAPTVPTCSDGIQNGDEGGVDCGGSLCAPCNSETAVTLLSPDTGEEICSGSDLIINWTSEEVAALQIAYAFGSEQTFTSLTDSIAAADSLFIWTIPADLPEGLYRIRISDASDT